MSIREGDIKTLKGRARSSSFNHSIIRRQQSDSHFHTRRPSFDSHIQRYEKKVQPKASHSNFLEVRHKHNGASSIEYSGSEEEEEDPISIKTNLDHQPAFVGKYMLYKYIR